MSNEKKRLDPDTLLKKIQEHTAKETQGRLTIFLGAAAGVGKTYAMLEAAHERLAKGKKVVIGWIETHGRAETKKLVQGLPQIPPKKIIYKNKTLEEMDLAKILNEKPDIVLVDELAHTNVPGSCHVRRYQDVEELLTSGINVYTTLNIQHVESLNDVITQITGIVVQETVPDSILEQADQIQLVDIPPEELIQRLNEGKIYLPEMAVQAARNFFRIGNINALRELALRRTADRVDKDLTTYMKDHAIAGPWPADEKVMVCVSPSPFASDLIRAGRRLATALKSEWIAAYIEAPKKIALSKAEKERVARNLLLAESLGAKTISASGSIISEELINLAQTYNVTHIIIGKPLKSRLWDILHGSVVDQLIRKSGGINIHVIQGKAETSRVKPIFSKTAKIHWSFTSILCSISMTLLVTGLTYPFHQLLDNVNIALLYLIPVLLSAVWWGLVPSITSALFGLLNFDYWFVPPVFSFTVADLRYVLSFLMFVLVAVVTSKQAERLKQQAKYANAREKRNRILYELSREITAKSSLTGIAQTVTSQISATFDQKVILLLPDENKQLKYKYEHSPTPESLTNLDLFDSNEQAVASWVYEHKQVAGKSTDTLPGANFMYLPLKTDIGIYGVLGIRIIDKHISPEQRYLLEALANLVTITIERVKLTEQAKQAELVVESDKLRTALFNSISHELRTPLSSIIGAVSILLDTQTQYPPDVRHTLLETIREGSSRMNRLITNLLDSARLESGMMKLKLDWCDIGDVIGTAIGHTKESLTSRSLKLNISHNLPLIQADSALLEQVMINLIDNASKYSVPNSEIEIVAVQTCNMILVQVKDRGSGIPEAFIEKIFDKFFRLQRSVPISGTGLGLSICKGIIDAHGGRIWASNRLNGGTTVQFTLPINSKPDFKQLGDINE